MKARTLTTKQAIKAEVEREFEQHHWEIFQTIASDIAQQALSNVLLVLEKSYGFGKVRLNRFLEDLKDMSEIMETPTPMTGRFTTADNIRYFRDKYGIDLREFKIESYHDTTRRNKNGKIDSKNADRSSIST